MNVCYTCTPEPITIRIEDTTCPYSARDADICPASFSRMHLTEKKKAEVCLTEHFDVCPLFLSTILRQK